MRNDGMKLKISDYCLIVPDLERAVSFYGKTIGLPMRLRNEDFADFDLGEGARLALWHHPHVSQAVGTTEVGPHGNRTMAAIRLGSAQEVDAAYDELKARGVDFVTEPRDWPWGARAAYFKDPDGYLWEIYTWTRAPRTL